MVSLSPKSKKCQSKDGVSVKKPVIVINAKLTCTRTKVENFRTDLFKVIIIRKLSTYKYVFKNSQKSGMLVIRIGKNKKYFHVCNYPKLADEGYGAELTKGKTMRIAK